MSSHHFVKDGQEPALILANGAVCSQKILSEFLEWCPFVLVVDGALQTALDKGIAFNAVSGDFDSETNPHQKLQHLPHVEIIETPDQDFTDLHKAVMICIEKGYKTVHVLWGTGKRTDHTIGNLDLIVRLKELVTLCFWDDFHKIYRAPDGFKKWYKKGTDISLLPWHLAKNVTAQNLQWPLNKLDLRLSFQLGTCNKIAENGFLEIHYEEGDLLMMEGHFGEE